MREVRSHTAFITAALVTLFWFGSSAPAAAQTLAPQERLCDPTFEDCRADILTYIQQETVEIDMGFWMMTDARYSNALVAAWNRGVKIRLLMDPRCADQHEACGPQNDQLAAARIPMRKRLTNDILHWKVAIFAGQGQVEFAGANYAPFEMTPEIPFVNFTDEIVMFTNNPSLVQSFMRRFDDLWVSTTEFATYANPIPLARSYPLYSIDPQLNFPPDQSYRTRALNAYAGEQQGIDVLMFRITDESHSNAMIAAHGRGLPVRLITDETEYRNPLRLFDAYNVDKMYNAGVQVRFDGHQGIDHAKGIVLKGTGMTIFGSSNWTASSSDGQREHNLFTTQPWAVQWVQALFDRKWTNATGHQETKPFVPLPPDTPVYNLPANGATGIATSGVTLSWNAGLWAHKYDIYFGTTPNPPLIASNAQLGPSQSATDYRVFALPTLQPGTKYFWKITSKTMAFVTADGPVWSFTTGGATPPPSLPAGWNDIDVGATGIQGTASGTGSSFSVSGGGADVWGTADAFNYAYRALSGDGTIVARLSSTQAINSWTKAGVMIRSSLSASSAHAFMLVAASATKGVNFQRRLADDIDSVGTTGTLTTAPRWVKLVRAGDVISGYEGSDGVNWTLVGSDTFAMPASVLVGLAVTSHVAGTTATATFDNVTVTSAGTPPNAPPTVSLSSPASGATFTAPASVSIAASASDSDGTVARVDFFANGTLLGTDTAAPYTFAWSNVAAGTYNLTAVATDNAGATGASAAVSITVNPGTPPPGLPAGWNDSDVGATGIQGTASGTGSSFSVSGGGADVWGTADAFNYAYRTLSGDGTIVARLSSTQAINSWTKAGVMIRGSLSASSAHAFMLVAASPTKGVNFQRRLADGNDSVGTTGTLTTAPRWVKLVRAGDVISGYEGPDGVNWTLVGSDTFAMPASVLVGLAVTSHVAGTNATATFDNVTVTSAGTPPNAPPTVSLASPAGGATFTAPASVSIAASASDSDGTVARVDFFANGTLLGTDTAAPYTFSWSNVAAGTYNLTAVATDNAGATGASAAVSIIVGSAPPPPPVLPAGWSNGDVGATGATGSSTFSNGAFSVSGAGADVWGNADAFQFAYVPLSGDGTIVARVASIQFVNSWTKVGVMIRESLAADAAHAFMLAAASSVKGVNFQRRLSTGDISLTTAGPQVTAPRWVKLVRTGNVITGYQSADGVTWTMVGSDTFAMGPDVLIGLAVTSHVAGTNATGVFDNVSIQ